MHRPDDIAAIVAERVHRRRRAPHVHGHVRQAPFRDRREHVFIQLPQGNVIHQERPHGVEHPPDDASAEGVHGQQRQQLRGLRGQSRQRRRDAVPFLRFGHRLGPRTGRTGAEIEVGSAFRGHLPAAGQETRTVQKPVRPEHAARRIERIAGQVDDSHDAYGLFHCEGKDDTFFRKTSEKCLPLFT